MAPEVKICGISTANDYIICRDAGARWTGMVYYPRSSRHLDLAGLAALADCADSIGSDAPERVLLSVDIVGEKLMPIIEAARPDMLQLHGKETCQDVADIKARTGLPVIKAIAVETAADLINAPNGIILPIGCCLTPKSKPDRSQAVPAISLIGQSLPITAGSYHGCWQAGLTAIMWQVRSRLAQQRRWMCHRVLNHTPEKRTQNRFMPLFGRPN